ncbi:MAG: hypothetical protein QGG09_17265 [Pirellulaceae bacterium]|nr:hypothetical protein [Pirellulaceae bacterium]HJN08444.1 hypothetical protein [Pirellulaceae bacterium]
MESRNIAARPVPPAAASVRASSQPSKKTLARRVAGFATNVLASGLILILGAVGGQHALRWWSAGRSTAVSDPLAQVVGPEAVQRKRSPVGAATEPLRHMLAFGDYPLLATRSELRGDTPDVLARLRADCRTMAERISHVDRKPGPAEQQMLTQIRLQEPVESSSRWRMYQIDTPLPMVVTVLDQPTRDLTGQDRIVAAMESRVVSWGLAFPAVSDEDLPSDRWTVFTLTAEDPQLGPVAQFRTLPIPPQSRRTMSLQAESGAVMVGFRGTGSIRAWQLFYNRQLAVPTWTPTSDWRHDGPTWQRSFTSLRGGRLDVQLIEETDGSLNGLLMSAPPIGGATER